MEPHPGQQLEAGLRIALTFASALIIGSILRHANYYQNWKQRLYAGLSDAVAEAEGTQETLDEVASEPHDSPETEPPIPANAQAQPASIE